ncbi:MAG: BsuBI/PstI family type II restriction endonuclease, partial [Opitutus sp.]
LPFFKSRRLLLVNPDNPRRPATSRYCVHQLDHFAVALVKSFGTDAFSVALAALLQGGAESTPHDATDASEPLITATLPTGERLALPRNANGEVTRSLLEAFCPKFAPGGKILYIAAAPAKSPFRNDQVLLSYGLASEPAFDLPDLVVHDTRKNRLVLVDAGERPIDDARRAELEKTFAQSSRRLVMITAFLSRLDLVRTIDHISTDTQAWVAESPSRLIQFNGSRVSGST